MSRMTVEKEWDTKQRCKVVHLPTGFWMVRYPARAEPHRENRFQDEKGYEIGDLRAMGTKLLREQWKRVGAA